MKQLSPDAEVITARHIGRCMERLEQLKLDPPMYALIREIVMREMRFLAEDLTEARDDRQ